MRKLSTNMVYDLEYRVTDMGIDSWHKKDENLHAGERLYTC